MAFYRGVKFFNIKFFWLLNLLNSYRFSVYKVLQLFFMIFFTFKIIFFEEAVDIYAVELSEDGFGPKMN